MYERRNIIPQCSSLHLPELYVALAPDERKYPKLQSLNLQLSSRTFYNHKEKEERRSIRYVLRYRDHSDIE